MRLFYTGRGPGHPWTETTRAVNKYQLVKTLNRNARAVFASKGIYNQQEASRMVGRRDQQAAKWRRDDIRVWPLHEKALRLGISPDWLLTAGPRAEQKGLDDKYKDTARTITREEMRDNISSWIRKIRKEVSLPQPQFYYLVTGERKPKLCQMSVAVSYWETGKSMPFMHVIVAMAKAEDVSVDRILYSKPKEDEL